MRSPIIALCLLFFTACAPVDEATERAPIGKADIVGSCDSACDGPAPVGNCWCDSECSDYGDCCDDLAEFCPGLVPSESCFSSADCDDDSHCSTEDGDCDSSCPPGHICPQVWELALLMPMDLVTSVVSTPTVCP